MYTISEGFIESWPERDWKTWPLNSVQTEYKHFHLFLKVNSNKVYQSFDHWRTMYFNFDCCIHLNIEPIKNFRDELF